MAFASRPAVALLGFFVAALLVLAPSDAQAQTYAQQVWNQLQAHYTVVSSQGNYTLRNYIMGSLRDDATDAWTFNFNSGDDYMITAACDNDCSDIDVTVKDSAGNVVQRDTETDDTDDDYDLQLHTPSTGAQHGFNTASWTATEATRTGSSISPPTTSTRPAGRWPSACAIVHPMPAGNG